MLSLTPGCTLRVLLPRAVNGVDWAPTFKSVQSEVIVSCDGTTLGGGRSSCKVELTRLPIAAVPVSCSTAECLDPVNGAEVITKGAHTARLMSGNAALQGGQ